MSTMFHVEHCTYAMETHMTIDVNNRESFRSNSVIRTEIDREGRKLTFHVFKQGSLVLDLSRVSRSNLDRSRTNEPCLKTWNVSFRPSRSISVRITEFERNDSRLLTSIVM